MSGEIRGSGDKDIKDQETMIYDIKRSRYQMIKRIVDQVIEKFLVRKIKKSKSSIEPQKMKEPKSLGN